jgi:tRNA G37 N-methylase Trm5
MELLAGDPDYITVAREHGFAYKLDFSKVYWNSRLGEKSIVIMDCFMCNE